MTYDSIFARSFTRHEQKKLGCGAIIGCFIVALCFCTVVKPFLSPLPVLNLRMSMGVGLKMLKATHEKRAHKLDIRTKEAKPVCDFSQPRTDICEMNGDIRIHGNSSTIFITSPHAETLLGNTSWSLRPYARKMDKTAMNKVRKLTIKLETTSLSPPCTKNHSVPAVVFSVGGYSGNHFHEFSDIVIPLYLTSRKFNGDVQFLIADNKPWWVNKFQALLKNLSKYEIIDIDREDEIHCFPSMIVGLKGHKEFSIESTKSPYSMIDFRHLLRSSYSLKRETATKLIDGDAKKLPRLLIISRRKTRAFTNVPEIVSMGKSLGYDVVVTEADSNIARFSHVVNSCDVMMGVHGAGLTNVLFLPENGVLIQVVPLGEMEWLATTDFGEPAKDMGLRYLEYKISEGESTLIQQYPIDHDVFRDPNAISKKGWHTFKEVYLEKQNVKLDVNRFRATLLEALQLLRA